MRTQRLVLSLGLAILAGGLGAQSVGFEPSNNSVGSSPTARSTSNFFSEDADRYLDPFGFLDMTDPVLFFQFLPETLGDASASNEPVALGLGTWLDKGLYFGAYYGFSGRTQGNLAGGNSLTQTETPSLITSNGDLIGSRLDSTKRLDYTDRAWHNPVFLAGLRLGGLDVGVRSYTAVDVASRYGTFAPGFNTGTYTYSWTTADSAEDRQVDLGGNTTQLNLDEVADTGVQRNESIFQLLSGGATLPFGDLRLEAGLGFQFELDNQDASGSSLSVDAQSASGFPGFAGEAGVSRHETQDASLKNTNLSFGLPLSVRARQPLAVFNRQALFSAGVSYTPVMTLLPTGEFYRHTRELYEAAPNGIFTETTRTTEVSTLSRSAGSRLSQDIVIPLDLEVQPHSQVKLAFGLAPALRLNSSSRTEDHQRTTTVVINDGDGVDPASDADDSTVTTVFTRYTQTTGYESLVLGINVNAGLQFDLWPEVLRLNLGTSARTTPWARSTSTTENSPYSKTEVTSLVTGFSNISSATTAAAASSSQTVYESNIQPRIKSELGLTWRLNSALTVDFLLADDRALNLSSTQEDGGFFDLRNFRILLTVNFPEGEGPAPASASSSPDRARAEALVAE